MDFVNAISKVRFSSSRPQRIGIHKGDGSLAELLCLEGGQRVRVDEGRWCYYVVTGTAAVEAGGETHQIVSGHFIATAGEPHIIINAADQRLVCLAIRSAG